MNDRHEQQPLVSVVTPVYNTGAYLSYCMESVIRQSYNNWEYIVVNNCSTDDSRSIAEYHARKDTRIRVVDTTQFLSQVDNYNFALRQIASQSTYCKIVQADDWVSDDCLAEMVRVAEADHTVGIVAAMSRIGRMVLLEDFPFGSEIVSGTEACRARLQDPNTVFSGNPTEVMYRSELVRMRERFFPTAQLFEDTDVCFEILRQWKFGFVRKVLSYIRHDNDSIMTRLHKSDPLWTLALNVLMLRKHGEFFFNPSEFKQLYYTAEFEYFRSLSSRLWCKQDKTFWDYHNQVFREGRIRARKSTVLTYAMLSVFHNRHRIPAKLKRLWAKLLNRQS